ncbi:hypothetical protein CHLRE_17g696200v5 [Chlamydomonas reinhardtii]|uniref:Transmembrane protein n=1 Tax=Chlamydomonas reinhardtii TaxID=3055 RepID=A0A2K3CNL1_CHLRE|nr:uncharacterized protein CHLRE_17g696200v5 [Chlamydomonas reinhardtii]PNW69872.1 hypothetical protein CHLRE_17g696200v5 [Chlamydomonas reinhardtii]
MAGALWSVRQSIYQRLESGFWVFAAFAVAVFGNGEKDLVTVALTDQRVNRLSLLLGIINIFFNCLLFAYVFVWLGYLGGQRDPLESGTLAIPAGAVTFMTTLISMVVALWPIFGVVAIAQVVVITYGLISALNFVPGWGPLKSTRAIAGDDKED